MVFNKAINFRGYQEIHLQHRSTLRLIFPNTDVKRIASGQLDETSRNIYVSKPARPDVPVFSEYLSNNRVVLFIKTKIDFVSIDVLVSRFDGSFAIVDYMLVDDLDFAI